MKKIEKKIIENMADEEIVALSATIVNGVYIDHTGDVVMDYPKAEMLSCKDFKESLFNLKYYLTDIEIVKYYIHLFIQSII